MPSTTVRGRRLTGVGLVRLTGLLQISAGNGCLLQSEDAIGRGTALAKETLDPQNGLALARRYNLKKAKPRPRLLEWIFFGRPRGAPDSGCDHHRDPMGIERTRRQADTEKRLD